MKALLLMEEFLRWAIIGPFIGIIACVGIVWNGLIVIALIRNRIPMTKETNMLSLVPFGLSLYFVGIGIGMAIQWYRDFWTDPEYREWDKRSVGALDKCARRK